VLDVHVHEAKVIILERAAPALSLLRRRQTAEPLSLEDAVDRIPVEMRQEVRDHEGEIIERKAGGLAQGTDNRPLLVVAFQGSLCGRLLWSWQSWAPRLRHLRMVSVLTPKRWPARPWARTSGRSPGERRGGAGLRVDGQHHVLLGEELGVAGRQSAKCTPQSRNAPDPNNVPLQTTRDESRYALCSALGDSLRLLKRRHTSSH
jgi:hypothetical protein